MKPRKLLPFPIKASSPAGLSSLFPSATSLSRQLKLGLSLSAAMFSTGVSQAQLAVSGTPGDRAVYGLAAGKLGTIDDVTALPSATHTWDFDNSAAILADNADSFDLGAEGGADETKVFLTGGHHLVIYGGRWDAVDERSTPVNYLKLNGSIIPYGQASGYTRDGTTKRTVVRGGTIINVAQGDYLEVESLRTDIFQVDENRPITQVDGDLQLLKLDDSGLDFLRLSRSTTTAVMAASDEGPTAIAYEVQDELSASSFDHSTSVSPEQVTLKATGHYLILANTGFSISPTAQRNAITQTLKLNGTAIDGGVTQVYLRNSNANDTLGGLNSEGAVSAGVLVEVTSPNSVLTVEVTRDNNNSNSAVSVDHTRTGLAIAKLPSYGEYINLKGAAQNVNTGTSTVRDFSASADVSNPSFSYTSGTSNSQVVVNKTDDMLFLSSFFAPDTSVTRGVVRMGFNTTSGGAVGYGASSSYARNQANTLGDGAEAVGNWGGAILSGLSIGDGVEVTTEQFGYANAINAVPTIQALNIASISMPPPVPVIAINNVVGLTANEPAYTIVNTDLGTTDGDNTSAELTYTLDSQPSGGTLKLSGATLNNGDTFTQDDIDNNLLTFEAGATETDPGGFDFTVRDPGLNAASGTFVIRVIQAIVLAADAATTDEDTTATEAQLTAGANLLSNDTGNSITITSFDSVSAEGAAVSVNPDGTFSYDPTVSVPLQQKAGGTSNVDSFGYTVTDIIGKTASATVTFTVDGINDSPHATNDYYPNGPLETDSSFIDSVGLTANDGNLRTATVSFPSGSDLRTLPGKTVSQSPSAGAPPGGGVPENAFDGNFGNFTHTDANNTVNHSWEVDFGQDVMLENVSIYNRTNCCAIRLRDITVTVLDSGGSTIYTSPVLNPNNVLAYPDAAANTPPLFDDFGGGTLTGRKLVITRTPDGTDPDVADGSILSLGEVTVIGSAPGTYYLSNERLLLNYEASQSAGTGRWENRGSNGGNNADWVLTGVTLDNSPATTRSQITSAYEWDNIADRAVFPEGPGTGNNISIQSQLTGGVDTKDATWEFWVKPANTTQLMTIYENGGGTGFGFVIDNGVLEAATEFDGFTQDGSYVSYDLLADPLGLVGNDPTTDFNQYAVTITVNGGLQLYVNGVLVDETTSGTAADWDGGDGAGLGRFSGANHGGYQGGAAGMTYDAPFLGQMAIVRLYSGVLSAPEIFQNFNAVNAGTDLDGDTISAVGIFDGSGSLVAAGSPATLASGAIVTLSNAAGVFDYNPNGAFNLLPGDVVTDTFTYRVSDGNGGFAEADAFVTIKGIANPLDDNVLAKEGSIRTFTPNEFIKNDETNATRGAYIDLTPGFLSGGTWTNQGSAGSGRDGAVTGSIVTAPGLTSGFQVIGSASTATNLATLDPISTADATIEIWFRPEAGQSGKKTVFESGGSVNGFSIVFDPATNEVTANVDGGDDATANIVATAGGISTSEFNQVIVLIDRDGGALAGGVGPEIEDLLSIVVNNDPTSPFDPTVDASAINSLGIANDWSGTDNGGLNATQGTTAFNENFPAAAGEVAIFRVYQRLLNAAEQEANFDSAIQAITGVSSPTTGGRTVTLNGDGTVSVDFSGVALPLGGSLVDDFTYTTANGTANVNVLIEANTVQEDWRFTYYGSIENSGPGADSALGVNGLPNLQNFAFDLNPTTPGGTLDVSGGVVNAVGPPVVWIDPADGKIYLRHTRRADFAAQGLTITDQFSREMTTFEDSVQVPAVIGTGTGDSGAAIEAVQTEFPLILPVSGGKGRYGRVEVSN